MKRQVVAIVAIIVIGTGLGLIIPKRQELAASVSSTEEIQTYVIDAVKIYIPDLDSKKCVYWTTSDSSEEYWQVEERSIQEDNETCPGDPNFSHSLAQYRVDKETREIKALEGVSGELMNLEEYFSTNPYTGI